MAFCLGFTEILLFTFLPKLLDVMDGRKIAFSSESKDYWTCSFCLCACVLVILWTRLPMVGVESLFPASRRQFVMEMYMTSAVSLFLSWSYLILGFLTALAVRGLLGVGAKDPNLVLYLCLATASIPLLFGILASPLPLNFGGIMVRTLFSVAVIIFPDIVIHEASVMIRGAEVFVAMVLVMVLSLGLFACYAGYHLWLETEFDLLSGKQSMSPRTEPEA